MDQVGFLPLSNKSLSSKFKMFKSLITKNNSSFNFININSKFRPNIYVATPVLTRFYHPKVIDHYERPRNVGSLEKNDPQVGTGLVGAPACGDVMKLQIKVDPESGRISDVRFKTFGCGSAIASSSLATEWIKGRTLEEAMSLKNTEIAKELCLPPVKLHCSMLAEDAIKSAVRDYQKKQQKDGEKN